MTLWTNFQFCPFVTIILTTFCHHQRQVPNYTSSCGSNVSHHSDSPTLTFERREFSPNEHGVAPTSLQQPKVELFLIRAGEPCQLLRLRQPESPRGHTNRIHSTLTAVPCRCFHHRCLFRLSTAQGEDSHSFGPRFHELATPHRITSHSGFSRGVASSTVCITKHFNIVVQLGPCISAGHSRVFD